MNVLVLGGTGLIGSAVTRAVIAAGGSATILCRSTRSSEFAESILATPLQGNIDDPAEWIKTVDGVDAVIHCACTFGPDMPLLDTALLNALFSHLERSEPRKKFIYTGGTWLYPDGGDSVIDEQTPYSPVEGFEWMVNGIKRVQNNTDLHGLIIHPAIVVTDPNGIPDILIDDFRLSGELHIPFSRELRWPIIHCDELADAYVTLLEQGIAGESYNAASLEGKRVTRLVETLGAREGSNPVPLLKSPEYWRQEHGELGGYTRSQHLASDKLRALGWTPRILPG